MRAAKCCDAALTVENATAMRILVLIVWRTNELRARVPLSGLIRRSNVSKSTYTSFGAVGDGAGWGEISARARALRSAYLAAQFRKAAATLFGHRR